MKRSTEYKRHKDREILTNLYVEQGLTVRGMAKVLGCGPTTVFYWLCKHSIPTRDWNIGDAIRGQPRTEEERKNLSEFAKKRFADGPESHPFYQRRHSEESKKKMSESMKRHYREKRQNVN